MPRYHYVAIDRTGDEICDIVDATSAGRLTVALEEQGLAPKELREIADPREERSLLGLVDTEAAAEAPAPHHGPAQRESTPSPCDWDVDAWTMNLPADGSATFRDAYTPTSRHLLRMARLESTCMATRTGERCIALLETLMSGHATLQDSLSTLASVQFRGSVGRTFTSMAKGVDRYNGIHELMVLHRDVFGDVALEYLRLGELNFGITESLLRYRAMRKLQARFGGFRPRAQFGARTRRFAIVFAGAQDLGGNLVRSLRCGAFELRRPMRIRVAEAMRAVASGEGCGSGLQRRFLLQPGFEDSFVRLLRATEDMSLLPEVLRAAAEA